MQAVNEGKGSDAAALPSELPGLVRIEKIVGYIREDDVAPLRVYQPLGIHGVPRHR